MASSLPLRMILLLGALTAFGPLAIDMYLPAFPQIREQVPGTFATVEMTLAAFLLSMALCQMLYGPLSDRFGRRMPLLFGCGLFAVGSLGCALAPSLEWLVAGRVLQGLGGAAGVVITRACVRDQLGERDSAKIFSQLMLVMGVAPILAPWVGGQMLHLVSWRAIFVILCLFGIFCSMAVIWLLPETLSEQHRMKAGLGHVLRSFSLLLKDPVFVSCIVAGGFNSGALFAYIAGAPFLYIELYGVSVTQFTFYFGLNALGVIGAAQLNQWLLRHYKPSQLLKTALLANAVFGSVFLGSILTGLDGFVSMAVLLFLCLASIGIAFPNLAAMALGRHASRAGSASSLLGAIQLLIGGLAGLFVGLLNDGTALPVAIVIAVCGVCGFALLMRSQRA